MIRIQGLTKAFGRVQALAGLDLTVARGEGLGLTGPNGGGRSTLLRILATLARPTSGIVEIDGKDVVRDWQQVRPRVLLVDGARESGNGLRVREHLEFMAAARRGGARPDATRVKAVLSLAGVDADTPIDALSAGLHQRMALAAAILVAPDVLLLDDPFRGLDGASRTRFAEALRQARDAGTTVVVAAQHEADLHAICRRILRLDAGRVSAE